MDSETRVLYWLLNASRGGPTRLAILKTLKKNPLNLRQLALAVKLDYKTVQEHVELLVENAVIETPKKRYGAVYFLTESVAGNNYLKELMRGNANGKEKRK